MAKPQSIDAYLATLNHDKRAVLQKLRKTIRSAAPGAEECITYGICVFRDDGMLVGFGATAEYCAPYLMSSKTIASHPNELKGYDTSKGTSRFKPDEPLPAPLVRRLVKARLAEKAAARKSKAIRTR
jgi:uncharacterized protein YdhG (YjbR/CyaY superfamily)